MKIDKQGSWALQVSLVNPCVPLKATKQQQK